MLQEGQLDLVLFVCSPLGHDFRVMAVILNAVPNATHVTRRPPLTAEQAAIAHAALDAAKAACDSSPLGSPNSSARRKDTHSPTEIIEIIRLAAVRRETG